MRLSAPIDPEKQAALGLLITVGDMVRDATAEPSVMRQYLIAGAVHCLLAVVALDGEPRGEG